VRDIADILEITDLLERYPRGLSGGQAQRTGLARALIRKPEVFVLDEPISHLDTRQRSRMRAYLKRLHIELGHTMVYVTHDQEEAMAMADRITIMRDGLLIQTGPPEEVYHHPDDIFVAGFIGEPAMNFLKCQCVEDSGNYELKAAADPNLRVPLPAPMQALAQAGQLPQEVTLGVRPFYVDLSFTKDETFTIPGQVFVVEPLGEAVVVTVDVADTRMQVVAQPGFKAAPKQPIWLSFESEHIRLFDDATGRTMVSE
jgi:ABC-type sugar transport system ATPase subunit